MIILCDYKLSVSTDTLVTFTLYSFLCLWLGSSMPQTFFRTISLKNFKLLYLHDQHAITNHHEFLDLNGCHSQCFYSTIQDSQWDILQLLPSDVSLFQGILMCRILFNGTRAEDQHILHASPAASQLFPKGIQLCAAWSGSRYWCPQCNWHLASRMGFCKHNTKHSGWFLLSNWSSLSMSLHCCILWNHTLPQVYHNSLATNIKKMFVSLFEMWHLWNLVHLVK